MKPAWKVMTEKNNKKPQPLIKHKKRKCITRGCGKRTGNGGANRFFCDAHHKALSGEMD